MKFVPLTWSSVIHYSVSHPQ